MTASHLFACEQDRRCRWPVPPRAHRRARPRAAARGGRPTCARTCPRSPTRPSRPSSPRSRATRGPCTGPMGENIRNAVAARARRLPLPRQRPPRRRPPDADRARGRGRLPARPRRGPQRPDAPRRCSRRTGSARGSPGARCPRPRSRAGVDAETLVAFAELVFAYIDELSAASVAGHTDELATTGRVRQRLLERMARHLLDGLAAETVLAAAERAGWEPPTHADRRAGRRRRRSGRCSPRCRAARSSPPTCPSSRTARCCWCPDAHGAAGAGAAARARRPRRRRRAGPAVAGGARVVRPGAAGPRARHRATTPRRTWPSWCCAPTPRRCADLRAQVLAPLADLRPGTRREAGRHAALLAAAPRPARRRRRGAVRARRRPCATGWASCASCTATASTTRRRCWRWSWRWARTGPAHAPLRSGRGRRPGAERRSSGSESVKIASSIRSLRSISSSRSRSRTREVGLGVVAGQVDAPRRRRACSARRTPRAGR